MASNPKWKELLSTIERTVQQVEGCGKGSPESAKLHAKLSRLLHSDLISTWDQVCIDLLPVMKFRQQVAVMTEIGTKLQDVRISASALKSFADAFRQHPEWPGFYGCMIFVLPLKRAVCLDPELRPLLRHGLNALLAEINAPGGLQEFKALPNPIPGVPLVSLYTRPLCVVSW